MAAFDWTLFLLLLVVLLVGDVVGLPLLLLPALTRHLLLLVGGDGGILAVGHVVARQLVSRLLRGLLAPLLHVEATVVDASTGLGSWLQVDLKLKCFLFSGYSNTGS